GARAGQIDLELGAHAEAVRHCRDPVDADAAGGLVEIHVAAVLDRTAQIERAVTMLAPAMEPRIADIKIPLAEPDSAWRNGSRLKSRERHRHLEGRPGRVHTSDRAIEQRRAPVMRPLDPLCLRHAGIEQRWIK